MDENQVNGQNEPINTQATPELPITSQSVDQVAQTAEESSQPITQNVNQTEVKEESIDPNFSPNNYIKKNNKKKMIIIIIAVVVVIIGFLLVNNKMPSIGNKNKAVPGEETKINVETGSNWGNSYAFYVQDYFKDRDTIDLAFIDINFDDVPEMIIKYKDTNNQEVIKIMQYANNEVSESKEFRNASFRLIYQIKEKDVRWYLFINSMGKYGTFTEVTKICNGTAFDSDIKYTNDKEIASFNKNFISSEYKFVYFPIEKESFEKDMKNAVSKFDNKELNEVVAKLKEDNKNLEPEEEIIDDNPAFNVGEYSLTYGTYFVEVDVYTNGEISGTEKRYITINRNKTLTINGEVISFKVFSNTVILSNGVSFIVSNNDVFNYGNNEYHLGQ